jgi:Kef-type K+ transport system membrane component KefB
MRRASFGSQVFVGAAITATSVGITARVLRDMGASRSQEARIILGAAVIDDVLALVVLGVIVAWVTPGPGGPTVPAASIAALIMKTFGFLVIAIVLGTMLTPAWFRQAARLRTEGALLGSGLCFCFLLCWAATALGLSAIVGAFAAGLVLEDAHSALFVERGERPLVELLQPMTSFLVPIFFVLVGFRVNVASLATPAVLALPLALTVAAVAGKLSCAIGVLHRGANRLTVAIGMVPRGEVALVFAAVGGTVATGQAPILNEYGYTAIVTVVILTTLLTPSALKWSLRATTRASRFTTPAA